jgi:hypothetical protein
VRDASNVPWKLGTTYRRQALFMCEGSPDSPRSPTGHPRNKQNGSEECPRSSYHAGRGHQVQGGRRPIMKIPFRVLVWPKPAHCSIATVLMSLPEIGARESGRGAQGAHRHAR